MNQTERSGLPELQKAGAEEITEHKLSKSPEKAKEDVKQVGRRAAAKVTPGRRRRS